MPKLMDTKVNEIKVAAEKQETGGKYVVLPEGRYRVRLMDVESTRSGKGDLMWIWTYKVTAYVTGDGIPKDDRNRTIDFSEKEIKYYTVIKDSAYWDLIRVYEAFGAEVGSDTDALIGDEIIVDVIHKIQQRGRREGLPSDEVSNFYSLDKGVPKAEEPGEPPLGAANVDPAEVPF